MGYLIITMQMRGISLLVGWFLDPGWLDWWLCWVLVGGWFRLGIGWRVGWSWLVGVSRLGLVGVGWRFDVRVGWDGGVG